jgi:hypothetical protein
LVCMHAFVFLFERGEELKLYFLLEICLAYRRPHALHNSFGPLGPFLHSGESVLWHWVHILGTSEVSAAFFFC